MSKTITLEIGDLYADLHETFEEEMGKQYEVRARESFENFLHDLNQQVERQQEQVDDVNPDEIEEDGVNVSR